MKVNVGVGAYRCDEGMPFVLPCVRKAEAILQASNLDHEYLGIAGCVEFVNHALEFVYGADCKPLQEGRIAGVQTLSGTGGLRVMGEVLKEFGHTEIYVPNPTWGNHIPIFRNSGLEVKKYAYYDFDNSELDFANLIADIMKMPEGVCILMHVCAHNPTGMDPTIEQWKEISDAVKERGLLPFFDCAYQGFASGDARKDAAALRLFVEEGHNLALVQSFSKNFGLYGQRVGALSIVADSEEEAKRVHSQLKVHIRPSYSNPPRHGARIVTTILKDDQLTEEFIEECKGMAARINSMRTRSVASWKSWDPPEIGRTSPSRSVCLLILACRRRRSSLSATSITFTAPWMDELVWPASRARMWIISRNPSTMLPKSKQSERVLLWGLKMVMKLNVCLSIVKKRRF